jgi:hypothetical protein
MTSPYANHQVQEVTPLNHETNGDVWTGSHADTAQG